MRSAPCGSGRPAAGEGVPGGVREQRGREAALLWGGVALALTALSPIAPRLATALPPCPLLHLTGLPCPSCGTASSGLALARFDFTGAFAASPLATLGWMLLVAGGYVAGARALAGRPLPALPRTIPAAARAGIVFAVLLNWAWLVFART